MDRDRQDPKPSTGNQSERHGPFGVRDVPDFVRIDEPSGEDSSHVTQSESTDAQRVSVPEEPGSTDEVLPTQQRGDGVSAEQVSPAPGAGSSGTDRLALDQLREDIVETMKTVYDPEIPVNIYDLGMVYEIEVRPDRSALVTMTLTSPACPVAGTLPGEVEEKLNEVEGVQGGKVELVWDPPWTPERMSEAAKLELGMF